MIHVEETIFKDARVFTPVVFDDHRGTFSETYSQRKYAEVGLDDVFVQDNVSTSAQGVLRGLHGDKRMSKLVQCLKGRIFDVIVDFNEGSPTFLKWQGFYLTDANRKQLFVPKGFAHGFLALTDVIVSYKQSEHHSPVTEFTMRWDDDSIGIEWPDVPFRMLSKKDANAFLR
jgi:dTDP-4-dehydrorhamnose 3,5-epimerase